MMKSPRTVSIDAPAASDDDARWAAVNARQAGDGAFVYAVTTTGIYCRPSCASRRPLRANTVFYSSHRDAAAAGFRACRKCGPDEAVPDAARLEIIERICRIIDAAEVAPPLVSLAAEAGMSAYHFHRVFRATVGVTPKAYAGARRRERLQRALPTARSVTEAAYEAGFDSSARFYARAAEELGMSPNAYRSGGANGKICFATGTCSLGAILVAVTERGVCAVDIGDDPQILSARLMKRFPLAAAAHDDAGLARQLEAVIALADCAPDHVPVIALDIAGTAFAQRVWAALRAIPFGTTATYESIAKKIGMPGSARAVANACASNPVALAIPCHRVVRADGAATAYRWGAARKHELLRREREKA